MTITSVSGLREHLQTAIELEHSTLPPYLCALYSIVEGTNTDAVEVVSGVVIEEMLHLTLAANLLNAVGGRPVLDDPRLLPPRPAHLPHSDGRIELNLRSFTPATVEGFLAIERPAAPGAPAQDEGYATIGQFYAAIEDALVELSTELGERVVFCGDPARQVTDALYYGGAGRILSVTDLASARLALAEIVEQGEGLDHATVYDGDRDMFHPEREEVAHYFRFLELLGGRRFAPGDTPSGGPTGPAVEVDWSAVHPMTANPRVADHAPGSPARVAMEAFNASYCRVLQLLQHTFDGVPSLLAVATGAMYGLREQMVELIALDADDALPGRTVGPSFEWVPPTERHYPAAQVVVVPHGPYLVRGPIDVHDVAGERRVSDGVCVLCRCGGSRTKPFCDGTHARIGFDGTESADHGPIAGRRRAYRTPDGTTVYDDRTRCAHFGQCTDRLPQAFGVGDVDFVDPAAAPPADLVDVTRGCPSGALAHALPGSTAPDEDHRAPAVRPIVDGPHHLRGGIEVVGADRQPYEVRERQTLCRCGNSRDKPFCDGSHWYAGFRDPLPDPLPPELAEGHRFPWTEPGAADRGRERYARERAARSARTEVAP